MVSDAEIAKFIDENDLMMQGGTVNDLRTVTQLLELATKPGGLADPIRNTIQTQNDPVPVPVGGCTLWSRVAQVLSTPAPFSHRAAVERFYLAWWNAMTGYQLDVPGIDPRLCHRGSAGYGLAMNRWA